MSLFVIKDQYDDAVVVTNVQSNGRIYIRVQEASGLSSIAVSLTRKQAKELRRSIKQLLEEQL